MTIRINKKFIDILNDDTTRIKLSFSDNTILVFKGVIDIDEDGKIICLQSIIEREEVNPNIFSGKVNIAIMSNKINNFKITGVVKQVINSGEKYELYKMKLNKINPKIILSNMLIIEPYKISSESFIFCQEKFTRDLISVQIDKVVNI